MLTSRRPTHPTEGQRLYAIGDVHGRLDLLNAMLGGSAGTWSSGRIRGRGSSCSATMSIAVRTAAG